MTRNVQKTCLCVPEGVSVLEDNTKTDLLVTTTSPLTTPGSLEASNSHFPAASESNPTHAVEGSAVDNGTHRSRSMLSAGKIPKRRRPSVDDEDPDGGGRDLKRSKANVDAEHDDSTSKPKPAIPRPPNVWILVLTSVKNDPAKMPAEYRIPKGTNPGDIAKILSPIWRHLPAAERESWETKAKEVKRLHKERYPDYQYKPGQNKGGSKPQAGQSKRQKG